ncbi:hypothetical protein PCO31110_02337 [Pandoraea communis]|uniref:Uncharacterized protein n=1 Tax=Pandoraea communis TaxID=2508297 RepID=A0A5E4UZV1_9BURK|nr:hypothetical protein [Pandoraea communis]VVE04884.1 hypothetical protein PCO31110_02337 [Pandoraea communis]
MIVAPIQTQLGDLALLKTPLTLAARKAPVFLQSNGCLANTIIANHEGIKAVDFMSPRAMPSPYAPVLSGNGRAKRVGQSYQKTMETVDSSE